jgi:hypothetical protein
MTDLEDFRAHLQKEGWCLTQITWRVNHVRVFLAAIGNKPAHLITEADTRNYFKHVTLKRRKSVATSIGAYIKFAARNLPVVVDRAGAALPPPARKLSKKDLALRERWTIDKLTAEKEAADDLIGRLARQVVNHYVYFEKRLKGSPDDLDEIARFTDEARALIESNLGLFMGLSASGRNINPAFTERILP